MTVVVGTAGHIDHGKTTLLRALTGIDADRLPEERRRGMTIDVGYAHLALPDGSELDFVDVPGHDRLVGNMLVGAGEIDAALLVVAADDGPRAQTIEHLELLDALGIRQGIAVVTKTDLVGEERTAQVKGAVVDLLGRTALADWPVLAISAARGDGLDELRSALLALRDRVLVDPTARARPGSKDVRLAVDRVFTVRGRGVVVTGSLRGPRLDRGAALHLVPGRGTVRARELQVHGHPVDPMTDGGRVAINLAGAPREELLRGVVLTTDPSVRATDRLLAILRPAVTLDGGVSPPVWPLRPGAVLRLHLGTAAVEAHLGRGRRDAADLPDGQRVASLRLGRPIAAAVGDRFVLRVPSPPATAAGGIVLESVPPAGASRRRIGPETLRALAIARLSGDASAELEARLALHGLLPRREGDPLPATGRGVGSWMVAEAIAAGLEEESVRLVDADHDAEPLAAGAPLAEVRRALVRSLRRQVTTDDRTASAVVDGLIDGLVDGGLLARTGDLLRDPRRSTGELPSDVRAAMDRLERVLAVRAPPPLAEAIRLTRCPVEGVRALEAAGRIVRVEPDLAWAGSTHRELEALALRLADPGPLTPAALRDATGTSRKYVMALLEDLDRRGVLRRTPDGHVRGPRAPG
jgi:selenocysteine-specific elongation factor